MTTTIVPWLFNQVLRWSCDKWKSYISIFTRPMATTLDREVASDERMLFKKSHNPLITWTHQVTWQMKKCYISISTRPVITKPDKMVAIIRNQNYKVKYIFDHLVMWGHVTNKKRFISTSAGPMATKLDRMMAYDNGSRPNGYMTQESLGKQKTLISISTRLMSTKLDKVAANDVGSSPTKSHDCSIT